LLGRARINPKSPIFTCIVNSTLALALALPYYKHIKPTKVQFVVLKLYNPSGNLVNKNKLLSHTVKALNDASTLTVLSVNK